MQILLAPLIVLSVTFVASKFYRSKIVGLAAGLLLLSGAIAARIVLPLPENMALILFPLSIYFYYRSLKEGGILFASISGLLMGLIALVHAAAAFALGFTVTFITMGVLGTGLYTERDTSVIGRVLSVYVIFLITAVSVAALWWLPALYFKNKGPGGVSTALQTSSRLSILKYPGALGYPAVILSAIGMIAAIRRFELEDRILLFWVMALLILSKIYYLGVNVITYRVLIYIMIPVSILAGGGLISAFNVIRARYENPARVLVAAVLILATFQGFSNLSSAKVADYGAMTPHGRIEIAPPSESEVELAEWFSREKGNGVISFSNYYTAGFVMAYTNRPVNSILYEAAGVPSSDELSNRSIKYLVFDKRLKAEGKFTWNVSENLLFYNPSIINVSGLNYPYLERAYENRDFVVYIHRPVQ
ncbi:hypothetical protein [Methanothermobacter sp.]|uniref:hypothetical protein n=1 Tax=Methanothermobacter sp. TaxID=1884223 RepID=UPI003C77280E